jgi:Raf kinase inhibitor-like YbhB/YbcL family protein
MMFLRSLVCAGLCAAVSLTAAGAGQATETERDTAMTFTLTSTAFSEGGTIPLRYTCDGDDVSPPLAWSDLPEGTASLVLVVDDPDAPDPKAPRMIWVHWLIYNLSTRLTELPEAVDEETLPNHTGQGLNDWKRTGYGGPCPPVGRHRYFHKLYALDVTLPDLGTPTKAKLEGAMQGHILGKAVLMGTYERSR